MTKWLLLATGRQIPTRIIMTVILVGSIRLADRVYPCATVRFARVAEIVILEFLKFSLDNANLDRFRALNRSEVLAGANFIALRRGSLYNVCARVVISRVVSFMIFQHHSRESSSVSKLFFHRF